jgi:hypothetical protein
VIRSGRAHLIPEYQAELGKGEGDTDSDEWIKKVVSNLFFRGNNSPFISRRGMHQLVLSLARTEPASLISARISMRTDQDRQKSNKQFEGRIVIVKMFVSANCLRKVLFWLCCDQNSWLQCQDKMLMCGWNIISHGVEFGFVVPLDSTAHHYRRVLLWYREKQRLEETTRCPETEQLSSNSPNCHPALKITFAVQLHEVDCKTLR